jgi:hypothetical protein
VNDPLRYAGYKFHQTAYFPDGARLTVRDLSTGRVVYDETLALTSEALTPRLVVRDAAGRVILDDAIVPTDFIENAAGTRVLVPGLGREFWVGGRPSDDTSGWRLIVFEMSGGVRAVLSESEKVEVGGYSLSFAGMTTLPSASVIGVPGVEPNGVAELSDGDTPVLTLGPVQGRALALAPGEPVQLGGYEYTFGGRREFAGITVRRDPGSTFIWLATGIFLLGLALTFYTPRRRLWGKITAGQARFRGLGGRALAIEKEIREVASRAANPHPGSDA